MVIDRTLLESRRASLLELRQQSLATAQAESARATACEGALELIDYLLSIIESPTETPASQPDDASKTIPFPSPPRV